MPFLKAYQKDFFIKDNKIFLSEEYLAKNLSKFKKITGSRFASIFGYSGYNSSVKTWAMMVNIYSEPIDEMYSLVGNVIEPKICEYVKSKTKINFVQYDPKKNGFDMFKENKIFGGIPDGEPYLNNHLAYPDLPILEIKTTSIDSFVFKREKDKLILQKDANNAPIVKKKKEKYLKWFDSNQNIIIPNEYLFQLGLYCYLRNTNRGLFAVCFLQTNDYVVPYACDVNKREIRLVDFNIDLKLFSTYIEYAKVWYDNHINHGISPELTKEDIQWLKSELGITINNE